MTQQPSTPEPDWTEAVYTVGPDEAMRARVTERVHIHIRMATLPASDYDRTVNGGIAIALRILLASPEDPMDYGTLRRALSTDMPQSSRELQDAVMVRVLKELNDTRSEIERQAASRARGRSARWRRK